MISSKDKVDLQKDQISNKTRFFSLQAFLKNQKFSYTASSILIFMFVLVLGFQNCGKTKNEGGPIDKVSASVGDKAIFKLSEKYGGNKTISNILWRIVNDRCRYEDRIIRAKGTDKSIEVNWNEILGRSHIYLEAFIQFEGDECVTYGKQHFDLMEVDTFGECTSEGRPNDLISITSALSTNEDIVYQRYFSVESSVNLGLNVNVESHDLFNVSFDTFQWSIKNSF